MVKIVYRRSTYARQREHAYLAACAATSESGAVSAYARSCAYDAAHAAAMGAFFSGNTREKASRAATEAVEQLRKRHDK